jgi:hypothetical protein
MSPSLSAFAGFTAFLYLRRAEPTARAVPPGSATRPEARARGQFAGDLVEDPFRDDPPGHEVVSADERACRNDPCRADAADSSEQPDLILRRLVDVDCAIVVLA